MSVTFYPNYIMSVGYNAAAEPSIVSQTYTCSGGETTGAAYDLVDNRNSNVITIDTFENGTEFTVDFDLTAVITGSDFAILDNHNLTTASGDIKVEYGGTPLALPTAYEGVLGTALAASTISTNEVVTPANGVLLINWSSLTVSNYEFILDDFSAGFDADVTMGEIIIGKKFTPSFSPELNNTNSYSHPGVDVVRSSGGPKYGFSTHDSGVNSWKMNWKFMSDADKVLLKAVYDVTVGGKYPFYIDLGESATPHLYRVRFTGEPTFTQLTKDAWAITVTVEEEL